MSSVKTSLHKNNEQYGKFVYVKFIKEKNSYGYITVNERKKRTMGGGNIHSRWSKNYLYLWLAATQLSMN